MNTQKSPRTVLDGFDRTGDTVCGCKVKNRNLLF